MRVPISESGCASVGECDDILSSSYLSGCEVRLTGASRQDTRANIYQSYALGFSCLSHLALLSKCGLSPAPTADLTEQKGRHPINRPDGHLMSYRVHSNDKVISGLTRISVDHRDKSVIRCSVT